jgi:hypothetical protein
MSFRVRVVREDGLPVPDITVVLRFKAFERAVTAAEMTNGAGEADFDGYDDGPIEVFVDGNQRGDHQYRDGELLTLSK